MWIEGRIASLNDCFARAGVAADCAAGDRMARLTYGLESYFVPQGEGRGIERTAASRVQVLAAVTPAGRSAIKALLIDGRPLYEEPPF